MNKFKKFGVGAAAAVTAAMLMAGVFGTTALAADDQNETVKVIVNDPSESKQLDVGNITAEDGDGLDVEVYNGGSAEVAAENIQAADDGVRAEAFGEDSTVFVTVNGDINGEGGEGVHAFAESGGSTQVAVSGDVTAEWKGVDEGARDGGDVYVAIDGDVTGKFSGVDINTYGQDSSAEISVVGDISGGTFGLVTEALKNSGITVETIGDIEGGYIGLYADSTDGGAIVIFTEGDVTGAQDGIYAFSSDGFTFVSVQGNVFALQDEQEYITTGVIVDAIENGYSIVQVKGSVSADVYGVDMYSYEKSISLANIEGDVYARHDGVYFCTTDEGNRLLILITGTVDAGNYGVAVDRTIDLDNNDCRMFVWRIIPNEAGEVAAHYTYSQEEGESYEHFEEFEKSNIYYIIRLDDPQDGTLLQATRDDGNPLDEYGGYQVAMEGDKVMLKVTAPEGYRVVGAYNGEGQEQPLIKDAEGNYFVIVPKGGGIYLSVKTEKIPKEDPSVIIDPVYPVNSGGIPKTGDDSRMGLWIIMLAAAVAGVGGVVIWRRRKAEK